MRRIRTLLVLFASGALSAAGQFHVSFPGMGRMQGMEQYSVSVKARFTPTTAVVGQPCAIVLEMDVDRKAVINDVQVGGLPDAKDEVVVYGEMENLADAASSVNGHVVKRMRIPARFLKPIRGNVSLVVQGMVGTVQGGSSFFRNFGQRVDPFLLNVVPLPEEGRPKDFSGAVGSRFSLKQALTPDHVRPGDLVTATYTLAFDGHCPSNVCPKVEGLPEAFKAYDPKEIARTERSVTWTQMLVPRTPDATNSASVSVNFYNTQSRRYEIARANPQMLVFVSNEAASTENTSVTVTDSSEKPVPEDADASARPVVLRFAPSDASPVIATLPPGTPVKGIATWNGWLRIETPRAIGWSREKSVKIPSCK